MCPGYASRLNRLKKLSAGRLSILLTGETGTGKELVAQAIHEQSGRKGAFVALNCAALPASLLASELFGHVRGAYTGAEKSRPGAMQSAEGGTLFLDELGDAPMEVQLMLLRALETQTIKSVGSDEHIKIDVGLVSATSRDLHGMVADGTFREDLIHRIAGHTMRLPALRERKCDLPALSTEFATRAGHRWGLSRRAMRSLSRSDWSGNVRQLKSAVAAAVMLAGPGKPLARIPLGTTPRDPEVAKQTLAEAVLRQIPVETKIRATMWKDCGFLFLPTGASRRVTRAHERALIFFLLLEHEFAELPEEIRTRARRLFQPGWVLAERGRGVRMLARELECQEEDLLCGELGMVG